jgi:hypothetical protein
MGRYIRIENDKVVSIRQGKSIVPGEVESETGEIGEIFTNGKFEKPAPAEKAKPDAATVLAECKALLTMIAEKLNAL